MHSTTKFAMTVLSKCVTPYSLTAMSGEIQQPLDGDREVGKLTKMLPRISRISECMHFQVTSHSSISKSAAMSQSPTSVQNPAEYPFGVHPPPQYHEAKMPWRDLSRLFLRTSYFTRRRSDFACSLEQKWQNLSRDATDAAGLWTKYASTSTSFNNKSAACHKTWL